MQIMANNRLSNIIVVGDRVLIKPKKNTNKTQSGLYLPPGVKEKEKIQCGYIIKVGPGYPIPTLTDADESWKQSKEEIKYLPLQAKKGDLAVFSQTGTFEVMLEGDKFFIVPQANILILEREEDLM